MSPGIYNPLVEQAIRDFRAAAENALRAKIGIWTVADIPPNLADIPGVKQGDPFGAGGLGASLVAQAVAGAGDIVVKGAILGGAVVIIVMGARMILGGDGFPDWAKGLQQRADIATGYAGRAAAA